MSAWSSQLRTVRIVVILSVATAVLSCGGSDASTGGGHGASTSAGGGGPGGAGGAGGGGAHAGTGGQGTGAQGGGGGGAPDPDRANLWIDGDGGTCTRSATRVAYDDAAACASIHEAFAACTAGDLIVVKSGTYPAQSTTGSKGAPGCTVIGEDGTVLGGLSTGGDDFTLRHVTIDAGAGHAPGGWDNAGSHVTLEDVKIHGAFVSVFIGGGSDVTWRGGELGAPGVTGGKRTCNQGDSEPVQIQSADHVTFDGVTFHPQDFDDTPCASSTNGFHLEMVRIDFGARFVTIENSTFDDGDHSNTSSVFITNVNGDPGDPENLVFQNDFFGTADNTAFSIHENVTDCSTFVFAYDTFHGSPGDPASGGCTVTDGMRWIGNLGPWPSYYACTGTHTKNVWQDDHTFSCGTDLVVQGQRFGYENLGLGGADGFRLQAGSPAIDAAESAGYCTGSLGGKDHDGAARPHGAACDAGADER